MNKFEKVKKVFVPYALSFLVCLLALQIKFYLQHYTSNSVSILFLAVTVAAYIGGYGPGLFAVLFCSLARLYYFIPPNESFAIESLDVAIQIVIYSAAMTVIGLMTSSLRQARLRAEEYSKQKTHFVANVSHEIRTPVNAIVGLTNLLLDSPVSPQQKESLEVLKISSQMLLRQINDILDFSKLDLNKISLEESEFNLPQAIRQSLEFFEIAAKEKNITLTYNVDNQLPDNLVGDSGRYNQILVNLLNNAIKFTNCGSVQVVVTTVAGPENHLEVRTEVRDTGIGIPPEMQNQIFDEFFQVDLSTSKKYQGTGLGLSICKKLVQLMGGQIGVNSKPNEGSCFWFTVNFKMKPAFKKNKIEPQFWPANMGLTKQVLVVEDNPINQMVLVKMLEKLGCRVDIAGDGKEAIELFQNKNYNIVFMDCHMPIIDGYEAVRRIRRIETNRNSKTRIVALTADVSLESRKNCLKVGMDGVLIKPVSLEDLSAAIQAGSSNSIQQSLDPVAEDENINFTFLKRLQSQFDPVHQNKIIQQLVAAYVEQTPSRINELRQAINQQDFPKILQIAHTLNSSGRAVGAHQMSKISEQIERLAKEKTTVITYEILEELILEFITVEKKLNQFVLKSSFF